MGFIVYYFTVNMNSIVLGPSLLAFLVSALLAYLGVLVEKKRAIDVN